MDSSVDNPAKWLDQLIHQPEDEHIVSVAVQQCYRYTQAHLSYRRSAGARYTELLQISREQLIWDCIADMFARDEYDRFVEFVRYFEDIPLREISSAEAQMYFRRFIARKVNDRIFRMLREYDGNLGKLYRNLRIAARSSSRVHVSKIQEGNWVVLNDYQTRYHNAELIQPEFFEMRLTSRIQTGEETIPTILSHCVDIMEESEGKPAYPLIGLAAIIRSTLQLLARNEEIFTPVNSLDIQQDFEVNNLISGVMARVHAKWYERYVSSGKLSDQVYSLYLRCIEQAIRSKVEDQAGSSLYKELKQHLPDLSRAQYAKNHRPYLEYLYKRVKAELATELQEN